MRNEDPALSGWRRIPALAFIVALGLGTIVGSGGGGGDLPPPDTGCATPCVSGIATTGNPIGMATISLSDATGATRTALTNADGSYQFDTKALTAPFLLKVATGGGANLYSVSADSNPKAAINLTPLTDLVVRTWYGAQGVDTGLAFSAPASYPAPTPVALQMLVGPVQDVFQLWLDKNRVASPFSLIATPPGAAGSGVNALLSATAITFGGLTSATVTIADAALNQSTTLAFESGAVTATTLTTSAVTGAMSSSLASWVLPTAPGWTNELEAIRSRLAAFSATFNSKGVNLAPADLQPSIDPNLLDDGLNATQLIAGGVESAAGAFVGSLAYEIAGVKSIDLVNGRAELLLQITVTTGGISFAVRGPAHFKRINGNWVFSGNNRPFRFEVRALLQTGALSGGQVRCDGSTAGPGTWVSADIEAIAGQFSGGSVSGGGAIWPNPSGLPGQCVTAGALAKGATTPGGVALDPFSLSTAPIAAASLPPVGTLMTASMTPASGGAPVVATAALNAWTLDPVTITAPANSSIASIQFNAPTPVGWALPSTYPISSLFLFASTSTAFTSGVPPSSCIVGPLSLAKEATAGLIVVPSTCEGKPVVSAFIGVTVSGVNGEVSSSYASFQ